MATDWEFEQGEFENRASRNGVELYVDGDSLDIYTSSGSGYLRHDERTYIPIEVIKKLLEHAGYKVTNV